MKNAQLFSWKAKDFLKGFIMAILTVIVTGVAITLNKGALPSLEDLKALALTGLAAGVSYLVKNFFTNSKDEFMIKENGDKISPNGLGIVILFMVASSVGYAQQVGISEIDSTQLHNTIVNTANGIIKTIPPANPGIGVIQAVLLSVGSAITGACIHFFSQRNKKKKEGK